MGHHHHTAAEILEELLQHPQGVDIEVVGRLIEQQHIRCLDQQAAEMQPPSLTAGELGHRLVLLGRRKQEAFQQLGGTQFLAVHLHPAGGLLHHVDHLAFRLPAISQPAIRAGRAAAFAQQYRAVLIEVGEFHRAAQLQAAAAGRPQAGNHLQQAGFADAVGADDPHPVLGAEVVAEVRQQGALAGMDGQTFGGDRLLADASGCGRHAHGAAALASRLLPHRLNALLPRLLFGAAGLGALAQPGQFPPQGAAELGSRGHFGVLFLGAVGQVGGVVALVAAGFAAFHRHDSPCHPIQQIAIVGDQHQGTRITIEPALQPFHTVGIEMVGGFIEQQHFGLGHQGRRQGHPAPVAAGEFAHRSVHIADAEALEHLMAFALQIPGLAGIHAMHQGAEAGQQPLVLRGCGQLMAEHTVLAQQGHALAAAGEHLLQHRLLWIEIRLLIQ